MSAAFWAYSIAGVVSRIKTLIDPQNAEWAHFVNQVAIPLNLFNALVLINVSLLFIWHWCGLTSCS
jgi:hypothetical protein